MLTDFKTFGFFWLANDTEAKRAVFTTWFANAHKAAAFARMLLNPELIQEENAQKFPTYERRLILQELAVLEEENDLSDFIDEMSPLERKVYSINKNLSWFRRYIPPAYQQSFVRKVFVRDGIWITYTK
ncbi:2084_t:CDS:1 [Paraglomus brasilianum]|uniref:2084_t:CDS:1 n=1 Tax=Paraglomus brasilianum TaxID=144538 RepID=A0A9N9CS45_9GLOM|nr:2084_t:CDS:1 [Paraglomus brasilianum]